MHRSRYFFFFFKQKTAYEIGLGIPAEPLFRSTSTTSISISSLQTHNVNRCGRSRHLARKLSLRRKRSSPNVFEMRSEERRVGKECRSRWGPDRGKKKKSSRISYGTSSRGKLDTR